MKTSKSSLLLLAVLALGTGGLVLWAADKPAAPAELKLQADARPIDRNAPPRVSYSAVVKKTAPAVVYVFSTKKVARSDYWDPFFNDPMFRRFFGEPGQRRGRPPGNAIQQSLGSGVIVTENGYILTNNHVVDGADEVKIAVGEPRKEYTAKIIGRDERVDLAVLKIDATGLPALTLGDSDKLEVGDTVLAIGNPFGVGLTVTHGIVSALGRGGLGIEDYEDFIQTDAPINPGNSGGALLDSDGRLIGINTAILSRTGGSNGVGFAIPVNLARSVLEQIVAHGRVERAFLGVTTQALNEELGKQFGTDQGALITEIAPGSAAEKAGLKRGDVLTRVNDAAVTDPRNLALAIGRLTPGTEVSLTYLRDGKSTTIKVKLGDQPARNLSTGDRADGGKDVGVLNGVGVSDLDAETRAQLQAPAGLKGAVITQVEPDSASARAGLREGDVILELDHKPVANASEAVKLSEEIKGPKVLVYLWREGRRLFVIVDESKK
jgi:serine protease Do